MIKTLIVDDEPHCCEVLELLLQKYCPEVSVIACCDSAADALKVIAAEKIDLLFLDIEMPHANGFDLLENIPSINFELIFTTSYDQYAIKAIRFSALDYLLKPIDREELQSAVNRASQRMQAPGPKQIELLLQQLNYPLSMNRIALPTLEGLQLIPSDHIISCTSSSNYTLLHLKEGQKLLVSKTLKEIESLLGERQFIRVHHSHVVNLQEIRKYLRGEGGQLQMSDGSMVDVSRSRKDVLLKRLQPSR